MDPTPSLLSFGEAITLVRQRLNASSERAAAVIREALKSGEVADLFSAALLPLALTQLAQCSHAQ